MSLQLSGRLGAVRTFSRWRPKLERLLLNGVPPGTYTLQTWHETLKPQTQSVTVQAGERKTVDFVFKSN